MIDTEPVITLPMNVPSGLAPEPAPFAWATPFEPARATNRSAPRRAMADGWGPTKMVDRRKGGPVLKDSLSVADRSMTETVESPQSLTYRRAESATAV